MTTVADIVAWIDQFAPRDLAEDWDNTGLLVGDASASVEKVMTCLTITPESAGEAIKAGANLIVTHHPLPFRPLKRITASQTASRLLLDLIRHDIAIISPHTAFDSAANGINSQLAGRFQLLDPEPLVPSQTLGEGLGAARVGNCQPNTTLKNLIDAARSEFESSHVRFVGSCDQPVTRVVCCCGSGGSFLDLALQAGCDGMITGEATFHTCLEARASGVGLILLGHHTSERFAIENLAGALGRAFPDLNLWASELETDPIQVA